MVAKSNSISEGKRVFLRSPTKKDQAEYLALNRRSASFNRGLASPPTQPEEFLAYLDRNRLDTTACFLICRRADGVIMGSISASQIFRGPFQSAYLGYHIGAEFAQQGYMTEALALMLRHVFGKLKLHRVEANIQPGNIASLALVQRAGFVKEGFSRRYLKIGGRWRDHERWTLLVEDWEKISRTKAQRRKALQRF